MAEAFFGLSEDDRHEVLEIARERAGRPAHLLEKDAWVVWSLGALFDHGPVAQDPTFKGGTSLSKAYHLIDRFSEDIDLTVDIRKLIPELVAHDKVLPSSRSQAAKWTSAVREELPRWIEAHVRPWLTQRLEAAGLSAELTVGGREGEQLLIRYGALSPGSGYVAPVVTLEFGGRATGEPHERVTVECDMAGHVEGVSFPREGLCRCGDRLLRGHE